MPDLPPFLILRLRHRRTNRHLTSLEQRSRRLALAIGAVASLLLVVILLLGGSAYISLTANLPSLQTLPVLMDGENALLLQPTRLLDRSGQHTILTLENPGIPRSFLAVDPADSDHFSPLLIQATIASMQPDFWRSPGTSLENLTDPEPQTIAEHLVVDLLLWQEDADVRRSLRMRLLAAQITSRFGRDQVLEWYLNSADYGHMAYGANAAAWLYFGHSAEELSLAEASLLVAASRAPALDPLDTPTIAQTNQQQVLDTLLQSGAISQADHDSALSAEWNLQEAPAEPETPARAFTRLALAQLEPRFTQSRLERGGLVIRTTLDFDLQLQLICTVQVQLARLQNQPEPITLADGTACQAYRLLPTLPPVTNPLPAETLASAVLLDPTSGEVLALLGDSTLTSESSTLGGHAPGTLLTPLVAVTAFARGMSPARLLWDIPSRVPETLTNEMPSAYTYHGPVRLRTALANDYLAPLTGLMDQIGTDVFEQLAAPMGLTGIARINATSGLLLNGGSVTPLEAAQAFGVFATLGLRTGQDFNQNGDLDSVLVLSVTDASGAILLEGEGRITQTVLSSDIAYLVHNILADSAARQPSLGSSSPLDIGRPSGAKLGQTADGHSLWAVGYTPQRVAAIWLGLPGTAPAEQRLETRPVAGLEHALLQYATRDLPNEDWTQPVNIVSVRVCDPSGLLPTDYCPNVVNEVFLSGSEPVSPDTLYRPLQIDRETGRLATIFTPLALVEEQVFLHLPAEAREWALQAGIPLAPEEYDDIQIPPVNPVASITSPTLFAIVRGTITIRGTAVGENFTAYRIQIGEGLNPTSWVQIGEDHSEAVQAGILGEWDTSGLNGLYALRLLVIRQEGIFDAAAIQVTVDNTPPEAEVLYPSAQETITHPANGFVTLQAGAIDAVGISRVEWWVDNALAGTRSNEPYSLPWQSSSGEHSLFVRVFDMAGNSSQSDPITFTVP